MGAPLMTARPSPPIYALVTSELSRVITLHLADGIATKRARVDRPFRYRLSFEDLGTSVDCLVGDDDVVATTTTSSTEESHATLRLSAVKLSRLLILARQGVFDVEAFAAAGFTMEGELDLHRLVFELVGGAPSHFVAALDRIDRTCTSEHTVDHLVHATLEETEEAARHALRSSRPLLVRGFPFPWVGSTREEILARHGDLELWVDGRLVPLRIYADRTHDDQEPPREAYSPVNPTDAVYATNLVAPDPISRAFGSPLFQDRCGRVRVFGGRSVLPDPTAWARVTSTHRHAHEVMAWQVFGKKKWVLVPPAHGAQLELRPLGFETQFCGVLDPDVIDDLAFRKAVTTIVMEPGDLLVLPEGWFHLTYVTREGALGFSSFAEPLGFLPDR